jgi:ectoine hydroxylase-related dioxygenase (phytanoyl-CoA dioxygenase family)
LTRVDERDILRAGELLNVDAFRRDGFFVVDGVFSAAEVEEMRAAVESEAIRREMQAQGADRKTVHLLDLTTRHPLFLALARSEKILAEVRPLLGNNIQLVHSKLATKPPVAKGGVIKWHQDFAFFPHTNSDVLAVMVMLDDATPDNGCMKMVRGSHKRGMLDHTIKGVFTRYCQEPQHWADESQHVDITPRAGGMSIHHALTLHSSPNNRSGRPRRGITFQYRADDAYQLAGSVYADCGLMVSGERTRMVRCEPGVLRLPLRPGPQPYGHSWNQAGRAAMKEVETTEVAYSLDDDEY